MRLFPASRAYTVGTSVRGTVGNTFSMGRSG